MKITFFMANAYKMFREHDTRSSIGGAEVNLVTLARYLSRRLDYEIEFWVGDFGQPDVELHDGIVVRKLRYFDPTLYCGMHHKFLRRLFWGSEFLRHRTDLFVLSAASEFMGFITLASRWIKPAKILYRLASIEDANGGYEAQNRLFGLLYRYALPRVDAIVAQTEEQIGVITRRLGNRLPPIKLIRNGLQLPDIAPVNDPAERAGCLWVGRFISSKRPDLFLDLAERCPGESFTMIIPGDSEIRTRLKRRAASLSNVRWIDEVPYSQIMDHFRAARYHIITSEAEGFPNTLIQSCIAGTPVVSLTLDPDHVIETHRFGYVCGGSLDRAVEFLNAHDDALWIQMGKNAWAYVRDHHDIRKTAFEYDAWFKRMLNV